MDEVEGNCGEANGTKTSVDRVKVLAICLEEAKELGDHLADVLKPAQSVELVLTTAKGGDSSSLLNGAGRQLAKSDANLLVLCLPCGSGARWKSLFETVRKTQPELSVMVVLERASPDELRQLFDMGAGDFSLAPLRLEDLLPRIMRWSSQVSAALSRYLEKTLGLKQILGRSPAFLEALQRIPRLAQCDASVLITGETGTGKEMCARAIHQLGPRADKPFVAVNCGAIPPDLVENELFGHAAGAFTGASSAVQGLVHDAEEGTLFLDEIDCLPVPTQVKFLRFLQDQQYRPLGGRKTCQADVRVIAACNANLEEVVRAGKFRSDLFYRLNILSLALPALRERGEDVLMLALHFVAKYASEHGAPAKGFSRAALDKLLAHDWPGNVRELENVIQRAVVFSKHPLITGEDISLTGVRGPTGENSFKTLKAHAIAEFETGYIRRMLILNDGNISKAARAAKKNRRAFWELMRKHDVAAPTTAPAPAPLGQMAANPRTNLS